MDDTIKRLSAVFRVSWEANSVPLPQAENGRVVVYIYIHITSALWLNTLESWLPGGFYLFSEYKQYVIL